MIQRNLLRSVVLGVAAVCALAACGTQQPPQQREAEAYFTDGVVNYVALGDSFTAAPQAGPPQQPANGCARSTNNYPSLLAQKIKADSFSDVSCTAATTDHLRKAQHGASPPQFRALKPDTTLVTISLGGNDYFFYGTILFQCQAMRDLNPTGSPCRNALELGATETKGFRGHIRDIGARLVSAIDEIKILSPGAEIIVVGYPQLIPPEGTCAQIPMASGDYEYVRWMGQLLNEAMQQAAKTTQVSFVDVMKASQGHDACSSDPWTNGIIKANPGEVFHPIPEGQKQVAKLVNRTVRKLRK